MALFVCKMGKFMKKKGCGARKRRNHNKEYMRCYKCKSKDHVVAYCSYNSDNDEDNKKKEKERKEKKKKKEKKMAMWSFRIVMALSMMVILVMMTSSLSRRH
jgi:cation transport ATPase